MAKKLKQLISEAEKFLSSYDATTAGGAGGDQSRLADLLSYIERWLPYFQHERLIHLIVTVLFGLATVITIPAYLILREPALLVLGGLFLCLLFPYIVHYFHLENGVQQLYLYYNQLEILANPGFKKIY